MKITPTRKRKHKDFNADRTHFIGGSDVGTILGINPYKSMWTLWMEKTGKLEPEDISDSEPVWWGTMEEDLVAKRFCMKTGKKVKKDAFEWTLKEYPFLIGHFDRLIVGEKAGLECKTTSSWNKNDFENGEVPQTHYAQCMFYMALYGAKKWYYAVKRDNNEFHVITIERNNEEIQAILEACSEFWKMVEENIEPPIDGSVSTTTSLGRFFAHASNDDDDIVNIGSSETEEDLKNRAEIDKAMNDLKDAKSEIDNRLKRKIGDNTIGITDSHTISWKTQFREKFDSKRFKKDYPELYKEYSDITETRVMKIKKEKNDDRN